MAASYAQIPLHVPLRQHERRLAGRRSASAHPHHTIKDHVTQVSHMCHTKAGWGVQQGVACVLTAAACHQHGWHTLQCCFVLSGVLAWLLRYFFWSYCCLPWPIGLFLAFWRLPCESLHKAAKNACTMGWGLLFEFASSTSSRGRPWAVFVYMPPLLPKGSSRMSFKQHQVRPGRSSDTVLCCAVLTMTTQG